MPTVQAKTGRSEAGRAVHAVVGAVIGFVVGVVIDLCVWSWAFGAAVAHGSEVTVPLIVATTREGGDAIASSGPGIVLLPLVLSMTGLVIALTVAVRQRKSSP